MELRSQLFKSALEPFRLLWLTHQLKHQQLKTSPVTLSLTISADAINELG